MKHLCNKWSFKAFFNIFLNKVRGTIISKKKKNQQCICDHLVPKTTITTMSLLKGCLQLTSI